MTKPINPLSHEPPKKSGTAQRRKAPPRAAKGTGGGRPSEHQATDATRAMVLDLRVRGASQREIAGVMNVTVDMVQRHYADELMRADVQRNDHVESVLYRMASSGRHVAASIYWTKAKCGWIETQPGAPPPAPGPPPIVEVHYVNAPPRDDYWTGEDEPALVKH
ncbi:hypothetical protein SAMN05519104_4390 [Rhizobiales bacterium GAS188]|nr:hypothetical protein SAMN05519104_4390 [Rhizobiales bacterium GAS188]